MGMTQKSGQMGNIGSPVMWAIIGINVAWISGTLSGVAFDSGDDGRAIFALIAAIGGLEAALLLATRHVAAGLHLSAAGFAALAILAVGEAVAGFSGPGSEAVFANLAVLHLPAMWLIASQDWSFIWARAGAVLSGLFFLIYGVAYVLGDDPADDQDPLLMLGYLTWIVAIIGWTMTLRAEEGAGGGG